MERAGAEPDGEPLPLTQLGALTRDWLAVAAPLAIQRNIEIEFNAPTECLVRLHLESMAALLDNLIGNAVNYSPQGGCVTINLDRAQAGPRLTISEEGPGIALALRQKVFERFYRIAGQEQSGSGLGLAIAERAAARNGATITLADGPGGRGLAVTVSFSSA